jgi:hypothetical protein
MRLPVHRAGAPCLGTRASGVQCSRPACCTPASSELTRSGTVGLVGCQGQRLARPVATREQSASRSTASRQSEMVLSRFTARTERASVGSNRLEQGRNPPRRGKSPLATNVIALSRPTSCSKSAVSRRRLAARPPAEVRPVQAPATRTFGAHRRPQPARRTATSARVTTRCEHAGPSSLYGPHQPRPAQWGSQTRGRAARDR